jgi:glycosyltransferase 2 family protein
VAAAIVAILIVLLVDQWPHVRPLLGRLSVPGMIATAAAIASGIFATFLCWRAVLTGLGYTPTMRGSMRIFFIGQLGKYVPGAIWPAVAQMRLGREHKVPARASGAAFVLFMVTLIGTGLLVAVPTLPLLGGSGNSAVGHYWWTFLTLPVLALAVSPPVANRAIALVLRVARRAPLPTPLTLPGILRAVGWSVVSWIFYGLHAWLIMHQLGVAGGFLLYAALTGAFAAAWCVGPLMVVAPAGAGIREAALILLLGTTGGRVPRPEIIAFALISRLLFTVGDIVWGAVAAVAGRVGVRSAPDRGPDGGPGERVADLAHVGNRRDETGKPGR